MDGGIPVDKTVTILVSKPERLRDYFLRLGTRAAVVDAGSIRVALDHPNARKAVSEYLRGWVAANGVAATIATGAIAKGEAASPDAQEPAAAVPLPEPAPAPVTAPPVTAPPVTAPPATSTFFLERPRLGDLLLRKGLITQVQLERALAESASGGDLLGRVMIRSGFIFEDELARTLANQLDLPYANLRVAGFERAAAQLLPSAEGMRIAAIPIGYVGGRLRVAFADPSDETARALVGSHVGDFTLAVADLSDIELAWRTVDPSCAGAARGVAAGGALPS